MSLRIWVGLNSSLQNWHLRCGLLELYKYYTCHIPRQCGTKSIPFTPTQWKCWRLQWWQPKCRNYAARGRPQWRQNSQQCPLTRFLLKPMLKMKTWRVRWWLFLEKIGLVNLEIRKLPCYIILQRGYFDNMGVILPLFFHLLYSYHSLNELH